MAQKVDGSGDPNTFQCVHKVGDSKLFRYNITTRFSNEDKGRLIDCLINVVQERANPDIRQFGVNGLGIIRGDVGQAPNWQGADSLFVDDILADICDMLSGITEEEVVDTVINHICEQMSDMIRTNGTCPSGRVNRIFEVYMFLRDFYDGVHLSPEQRLSK